MMMSALYKDKHTLMDFYSVNKNEKKKNTILKKKKSFKGTTCRPNLPQYPDSEPNSLCTYSLMLHA